MLILCSVRVVLIVRMLVFISCFRYEVVGDWVVYFDCYFFCDSFVEGFCVFEVCVGLFMSLVDNDCLECD